MPKFKYIALQLDGTKITGQQEAVSKAELVGILEDQGHMLLSARKLADRSGSGEPRHFFNRGKKVSTEELVLFTRQFGTMFKVGVPLLRILYVLKDQVDNPSLKSVVSSIAKDVESGSSLADSFAKHPKVFAPVYCSMLAAGEASGKVDVVMDKLCQSMEYENEVKNLVKGAMQYPTIVLIGLVLAFVVLMSFLVPAFVPLFDQLGGDLPPLTKVCIAISALFTDYWYVLITVVAAVIAAFVFTNRTPKGHLALSKMVLRIPLVGKLMIFSFMARFGSLFGILQASGILIIDALRIVGQCIDNAALQEEIRQLRVDVESGESIADSLQNSPFFPKIMQSMIAIGEVSGNLEEMLNEASRHFEFEVHHAVKRLTGALGPILIVIMAIAVGFFAMAIYLPIWQLTEMQMAQ